ncbi:MAG: hypothetical protein Q4F17_10570 [Eubacteriales bacterium]|nr:hypothetical protein [Eubacteriales bacterium]
MKRTILILLSLLLAVNLTGCAAPEPPSTAPETETAPAPADFLGYIRDVLVPREGLASTDAHTFHLSSDGSLPEAMGQAQLGLLSACVRDFDADGAQELVTFSLASGDGLDTYLGEIYYTDPLPCLLLEMKLYTADENGQISLSDSVPAVAHLENRSWGPMLVRLDNLDGVLYIISRAAMEDMTTYGPRPVTIFHIEQGKFVFDYAGKVSWGQSTMKEDPNELLGTRNFYLPKPDSSTHFERGSELPDPELSLDTLDASLEAGAPWLVCGFLLETHNSAETSMDMTCKAGDATALRQALETGILPTSEIPDGHLAEDPVPEAAALDYAAALSDQVEALSGIRMEVVDADTSDEQDTVNFTAPDGTTCRLVLSSQSHELLSLRLTSTTWTPDSEWIALKDAILSCESLGLSEDDTASMLGDISLSTFSGGVELGNKRIVIAAVSQCFLIIDAVDQP